MVSRKKKTKPVETPFAEAALEHAAGLANAYHVILEPDERSGFVGSALEMPTVFARGKTPDACVAATRGALAVAIASMVEAGVNPPEPYVERRRVEQMNIRLDAREKLLLQQAAKRRGFRSVSDYVRVTALQAAAGESRGPGRDR